MTEQIFWLAMFGISAFTLGYLVRDWFEFERATQASERSFDSLAHGDVPAIPAGFSSEHETGLTR